MRFDTEHSRPTGLGRLASRLDFAATATSPATSIAVAPDFDRTEALGIRGSHRTLNDALVAARTLAEALTQPVAVLRNQIDLGEPEAPTFSVIPLKRSGASDARTGRLLLPQVAPTDVFTVDASTHGYAKSHTSVQALVTPDWETSRTTSDAVRWTGPNSRPSFPV